VEDPEVPEPHGTKDAPDVPPTIVIQGSITSKTVEDKNVIPGRPPQPNIRTAECIGERAVDEETHGDAGSVSQIDGLTLVASQSSPVSDLPDQPSFGHFSFEKQSQDVIPEADVLPRKLLWPKSRRKSSNNKESRSSSFGLE